MSDKLKLLAKSALAIPGMVPLAIAQAPTDSEIAYRYSQYQEEWSPDLRDDSGSTQPRYDIEVHQFRILHPVKSDLAISVESSYETLAGASPMASYIPAGSQEVYSTFAGASQERRFDLTVAARQYHGLKEQGANVYVSKENDYFALSSGVDGAWQVNKQMTTLAAGISAGHDWIDPLNAELGLYPARTAAHEQTKWQVSAFVGVGQVINVNTVIQASGSYTYRAGFLSDPYRDCAHAIDVSCDVRPDSRAMYTASLGLRRFLPQYDGIVHADYRYFGDTWAISSHTLDLDYYHRWQPQADFFTRYAINFQVIPGVRYYHQSAAAFYEIPDLNDNPEPYTVDTVGHYSSDPRLSAYGSVSFKLRLKANVGPVSLISGVERYVANPAYGGNGDSETPGLPAYWRFTYGADVRF